MFPLPSISKQHVPGNTKLLVLYYHSCYRPQRTSDKLAIYIGLTNSLFLRSEKPLNQQSQNAESQNQNAAFHHFLSTFYYVERFHIIRTSIRRHKKPS